GGDGKRDVSEIVVKLQAIEKGESLAVKQAAQEVAATVEAEEKQHTKSTYDEFDYTVLQQSKEQGFEAYEVTVSLREDCLLKAARVYMIFEVLEKAGEVIKANPPVEQLEEEQFDLEFTVSIITKDSPDD